MIISLTLVYEGNKGFFVEYIVGPYQLVAVMQSSTYSSNIIIVYLIESAAYRVVFTSCLCENPNERGTSK